MVGRPAGQVARVENQDLLRHAADGPGIRALDVALRAALAATRPRARAYGNKARGQADAGRPGGSAAARAPLRVIRIRQDFASCLRHCAGEAENSGSNARAKAISDS